MINFFTTPSLVFFTLFAVFFGTLFPIGAMLPFMLWHGNKSLVLPDPMVGRNRHGMGCVNFNNGSPATGPWHRVYVRYNRWSHKGAWSQPFEADLDLECLMVDGSIVWVHQRGAAKTQQQNDEAMSKSCGGLSTKIHAAVDALGNPVRLLLTAGQMPEYTQAEALIEGFEADYVLADKGYDSDRFGSAIESSQAVPVIPSKKNRIERRECGQELYKERNLVE